MFEINNPPPLPPRRALRRIYGTPKKFGEQAVEQLGGYYCMGIESVSKKIKLVLWISSWCFLFQHLFVRFVDTRWPTRQRAGSLRLILGLVTLPPVHQGFLIAWLKCLTCCLNRDKFQSSVDCQKLFGQLSWGDKSREGERAERRLAFFLGIFLVFASLDLLTRTTIPRGCSQSRFSACFSIKE